MESKKEKSRRAFLHTLGAATGAAALAPVLSACHRQASGEPTTATADDPGGEPVEVAEPSPPPEQPADPLAVPRVRPEGWDPIAFNRDRGNAGAIPESYQDEINGPDGVSDHLGKHLPFVSEIEAEDLPEGHLPLMFGDPELGYARHPNNAHGEDGTGGHWYDWIRLRKAVEGPAEEIEVRYSDWPEPGEGDNGRYAALGGGDITADGGRDTIYVVPLPPDVSPGDTLRFHGHCLFHGEYVDFITLPGG